MSKSRMKLRCLTPTLSNDITDASKDIYFKTEISEPRFLKPKSKKPSKKLFTFDHKQIHHLNKESHNEIKISKSNIFRRLLKPNSELKQKIMDFNLEKFKNYDKEWEKHTQRISTASTNTRRPKTSSTTTHSSKFEDVKQGHMNIVQKIMNNSSIKNCSSAKDVDALKSKMIMFNKRFDDVYSTLCDLQSFTNSCYEANTQRGNNNKQLTTTFENLYQMKKEEKKQEHEENKQIIAQYKKDCVNPNKNNVRLEIQCSKLMRRKAFNR